MPIDKFHLYVAAANRRLGLLRSMTLVDTANAIGFAFDNKGAEDYLKSLQGAADGK